MNNNISLRDWFAGQAIEGAAQHQRLNNSNVHERERQAAEMARVAYELADALLAAQLGKGARSGD